MLLTTMAFFTSRFGQLTRQFCIQSNSKPSVLSQYSYGQPTPDTHPHLLLQGQVVPEITKNELQGRRYKVMKTIKKHCEANSLPLQNHIAIIPSSSKQYISEQIPYPFRQNSDFLYLTGFQEPDSLLILNSIKNKELPEHKSVLFVPKHDSHNELWEGPRTTPRGAVEFLGIDESLHYEELENYLESLLRTVHQPIFWYDYNSPNLHSIRKLMERFIPAHPLHKFEPLKPILHNVRLIKSEAEIKLMEKSCEIASQSMIEVIKSSKPNISEALLWAKMEYECRKREACHLAYPPVIAGGERANTIHYINNNQKIDDGDMILMDAGCEYHGYTSDLTRTWPVNGQFSDPQREIYEAVQEIQKEIIELCVNFPSLDKLYDCMTQLLGNQLLKLKIAPSTIGKIELKQLAYQLCPHHVSHYLGMDVHDCGLVKRSIPLKPGMIITVEPGIYIKDNNLNVPPHYRGIGIRIEDDILITPNGPKVLTSRCPKTVSEIENLFM